MQVVSWMGSFFDWEQELRLFKAQLAPMFPNRIVANS